MKKINLFIIATLLSSLSWGQAFPEDFNYTSGSTVVSNGWTQISAGSGPLTVNTGGLTYPNSPSNGVGFGVNSAPGMQVIGRSGGSIASGTAYMSFLINLSNAATTAGSNITGIISGSLPSPGVGARLFTRQSGAGFNFGISKTGLTPVTWDAAVSSLNTTYLVVLKYTFNTGSTTDDVVNLWINPTLGTTEPSALLTMTGTNDVNATVPTAALIGSTINPRSGTAAPTFEIDAIRYSSTWLNVTPIAVPTLTVNPATPLIIGAIPINTTSASVSFNLAGTFLTPAPGTITVASPNTDFQVSSDNITFSSSINIPHTTPTLAATAVYVRFSSATAAASTVNLTISGGGVAVPPTVTVNASAAAPFYSKPTGSLHLVGTWGTNTDGTGTAPVDFITDNQIFTITNRATHTLDDDFQVFGIGSKIVLGNGTDPIKLILPTAFTILNDIDHKVDIKNNATLEVANKIYRIGDLKIPFPHFGVMDNNSTVEYTWAGTDVTDTVRIPAETFGNLKLINGLKYFSAGFAFANGTLDITNVVGLNGTGNASASILVRGNITMSNSFFDTDAFADGNRINLNLGGVATQTLSGGDFYVGQLRTQAVSPTVPAFPLDIILGANTNLITGTLFGTTYGGGINLQQPLHNLSLNGRTLTMGNGSSFLSTNQGTITGTSASNLIINKTGGTAAIGTARFAMGGQILNDFNFNSAGAGTNNLTLNNPLTVNGVLSLNAGNILLGSNTLTAAGTISGGSLASHIVTNGTGALKINAVAATTKPFPVGPSATVYHPATINNTGTSDNFSVNVSSVTPPCGDPTLSVPVRWNITEEVTGGSNCTITLDYNGVTPPVTFNAATAKIVDCNGSGPTYFGSGSVTGTVATGSGFTSFSPFGITSDLAILPVTFVNFSGSRIGKYNKLTWTTGNELNNLGFEVLRSKDGQNFEEIGFVNTQAPGGSTSDLTYNFNDDKINTNTIQYYKLRQVDINGQSKYSAIVKINGEKSPVFTIDGITPNPAQNSLIASISSPTKNLIKIQVLDMMGKMIQQQQVTIQEGSNLVSLNVSTLSSGIYLIKAIFPDKNQILTAKFIKQ